MQYGIIRRKNKDGTYSCLAFKPQELVSAKTIPIQLQSQDLVYFFTRDKESREELLAGLLSDLRNQTISGRFAKIAKISGSVHFPGEYPLTDSMSLSDLFLAGGGTKDSAYMLDAEISRVLVGPDQTASVEHIRLGQNVLADSNSSKPSKFILMISFPSSPFLFGGKGRRSHFLASLNSPGLTRLSREKP